MANISNIQQHLIDPQVFEHWWNHINNVIHECVHAFVQSECKICYGNNTPTSCFLLGMPDTSFNGLRTRSARRVLRSTLSSPRSPLSTENTVRLWYCSLNIVMYLYMLLFVDGRSWTRNTFFWKKKKRVMKKKKKVVLEI